ncbi:hypothetical protein V8C26DRAFT_430190 [Trichoderma gracile]
MGTLLAGLGGGQLWPIGGSAMASPWGAGGSRTLGEISGTATADAAAAAPPCAHEEDAAVGLVRPGRAIGHEAWPRASVPGNPEHYQPRIPSSGGASEGLQSPLGLAVEDERLPWSLEAPGGED